MAADAEIQEYFKKISKRYENIQRQLNYANIAITKNLLNEDDETGKKDKEMASNNVSDLEYILPSNIAMFDLLNDPKETFKLRRTSVMQKSYSKHPKPGNKNIMVPTPPITINDTNKYRRRSSHGWNEELKKLSYINDYNDKDLSLKSFKNNITYNKAAMVQPAYSISDTMTKFFQQSIFSKDKVIKLLESLWSMVEHIKKVNHYYVTSKNMVEFMRTYVKDRSHRPSLEVRIALAFDPKRLGKISLYHFIFSFTYYNNKLHEKEKIEIISILCMCKLGNTNVLQPRKISMENILSLTFGKKRYFKDRIDKSVRFLHKIQIQPQNGVNISNFSEIIKSNTKTLELFQPSNVADNEIRSKKDENSVLETFMKRRKLTWSSLDSLWAAISSIAENAAMIVLLASETDSSPERNTFQRRSYLPPDDFNKIICTFLEPCEPRDGQLVRELNYEYVDHITSNVDCWTLVSNLATLLNLQDIRSGIFDLEAKICFYFNFFDLDSNGAICQNEFKMILMSHQSKIEQKAFVLGLEMYGVTKFGYLESKVKNGQNRNLIRSHNINTLSKLLLSESTIMKNIDVEENDMAVMNSNSNMKSSFFDLLCELVLSKEN